MDMYFGYWRRRKETRVAKKRWRPGDQAFIPPKNLVSRVAIRPVFMSYLCHEVAAGKQSTAALGGDCLGPPLATT